MWVVLVYGKEHANRSNISEVMIGWSLKIKYGKPISLGQNVNLECQKHSFYGDWKKMDDEKIARTLLAYFY